MSKLTLFIVSITILTLSIALLGCVQQPPNSILVHVQVLTDRPAGNGYELREGEPETVGIYEFYLKEPGLPGSGTFKKLNSISVDKLDDTEFYGEKLAKRIDGTLCVGYPSTNIIDGKACVEIDQSQDEVNITVYYWETRLGILQ